MFFFANRTGQFFRLNYLLLTFGLCGIASPAFAEIQEYQIKRIILYKSNCKSVSITSKVLENNAVQYRTECENVTFYPDGVTVNCSDRENENSCSIVEKERDFDNLKMLQ